MQIFTNVYLYSLCKCFTKLDFFIFPCKYLPMFFKIKFKFLNISYLRYRVFAKIYQKGASGLGRNRSGWGNTPSIPSLNTCLGNNNIGGQSSTKNFWPKSQKVEIFPQIRLINSAEKNRKLRSV